MNSVCLPIRSFGLARQNSQSCNQRVRDLIRKRRSIGSHVAHMFPFDQAWAPAVNSQSLAPQLFAASLFPYIGFLYHLTIGRKNSGAAPVMVGGFYFLLAFVGATIPAGIYAKSVYHTSLANVDWLHGTAESLLTITNLLIVVGLRQAIVAEQEKAAKLQSSEASATPPPEPAKAGSKSAEQ